MKALTVIFLFISVNSYADWRVEFVETSQNATYKFERKTEQEALEWLEKIIIKSQWMKCNWKLDPSGAYAKKDFKQLNSETGLMETIVKYCEPLNFTVTPPRDLENNPTQEETNKKNKVLACDALKAKLASEDLKLDELNELTRCRYGL